MSPVWVRQTNTHTGLVNKDQDDQRNDAPLVRLGIRRLATREWHSHDGKRQLRLPFFYWVINPPKTFCVKIPATCPEDADPGVQRLKVVELVRDPTLVPYLLFPAVSSPDDAPGFSIQLFVGGSFMSAKQPNRKPTGKRKESDASAQEGRERKRAAKRKGLKAGSRQQVEQAGKKMAPSRPRIHASALASPSR
jgi:hypothetical protein